MNIDRHNCKILKQKFLMKINLKLITLMLIVFATMFQQNVIAQNTKQDSLVTKHIKTAYTKHLTRKQKLDAIDKALGKELDLDKIFNAVLSQMDDSTRLVYLKYIYRKANKPVPAIKPVAKIYWKDVEHDFGVVKRGKVVKYTFNFTNIGKIPYEIEEIEGSCGCTVASYTKGVIAPGGTGKVVVTFNSAGKEGDNTELVTVIGNSHPGRVVLVINVHVR